MILEFLDLEKNEEKLEYLKKHRLVLSERFLRRLQKVWNMQNVKNLWKNGMQGWFGFCR